MFLDKNNQRGNSLMEALAVITVICLLSASVFKIISSAHGMFKMSMATSEIKDLQKSISSVYDFSGNYDELFDGDAYKILCETDKSAPSQMCIKSGASYVLKHRLGGYVEINKSDDSKSYMIKFKNLKRKDCVNFTQIDWLDRKKISIYQIDVNDTAIAYFPKRGDKGFPVETKTSLSKCSKKDGENSITWYFY